jgi:hypothetical protein
MSLGRLWQGVQQFGRGVWKKLGDTSKSVGLGIGRFVAQNHQPLAMLAKSVGDASGNPLLRAAGNLAMSASGYTAMRQRFNEQSEQQRRFNRDAAARAGYRYGDD